MLTFMLLPMVSLHPVAHHQRSSNALSATWRPAHSHGYLVYRQSNSWWLANHGAVNQDPISPKVNELGYVSAADLTLWRSPRGLDFKLMGHRLELTSHDRAGMLTLNIETGACIAAVGCFKALRGSHLPVISKEPWEGSFFDGAQHDVLLPLPRLRRYLGSYGAFRPRELSLTFAPVSLDFYGSVASYGAEPWDRADIPSKPARFLHYEFTASYEGTFTIRASLSIHIKLARHWFYSANQSASYFDDIQAVFSNESRNPTIVQPGRLAEEFGNSLPCETLLYRAEEGHKADTWMVFRGTLDDDERDHPNLVPQNKWLESPTAVLSQGGKITLVGRSVGCTSYTKQAQRFAKVHYADGQTSIVVDCKLTGTYIFDNTAAARANYSR